MNTFIRFAVLLFLLTIIFSAVAAPVLAQSDGLVDILDRAAGSAGYDANNTDSTTLSAIVGSIVRAFLSLIGVIFISYTIYGGYLWMTAGGNSDRVDQAKKIIAQGAIGIIVTLSAAAIYTLVMSIFSDTTGNSSNFSSGA